MERNGFDLIFLLYGRRVLSLLWVPPGVTNPSTRRDLLVCAQAKCKEEINGASEEKQIVFWYIFQLQYCQAQDTKIMSVRLQILIYVVNIHSTDFSNLHFSISVCWTHLLTHSESVTVFAPEVSTTTNKVPSLLFIRLDVVPKVSSDGRRDKLFARAQDELRNLRAPGKEFPCKWEGFMLWMKFLIWWEKKMKSSDFFHAGTWKAGDQTLTAFEAMKSDGKATSSMMIGSINSHKNTVRWKRVRTEARLWINARKRGMVTGSLYLQCRGN